MLEADEAAELAALEPSVTLFDKELPMDEVAELSELDAFEAAFETSLVPELTNELAASERLEAESETTEAADLTLFDAFSTIPGSSPTTDADALAERLLALSEATEITLSTVPWEVPITELEA